ncbi:Methyltransferase-like protein 2-A [Zancudomyces culisetae]|uniref:Methyltransferase-like protein 2-A n=1 Tax=Zancudomyces culisetae TaxID=1213189 RepID=A0A1R1PDL0_ZANCU|nr:Methyltransferase-like protein 2-A [Zancudomyces culisetae]|eukprot:OMH79056.1 Methyltransferase-like protein 2-A [Zancudomyces culisetae]
MLNGGKRYSSVRDAENTPERSGEGKIQTDGDFLIKNNEEIDTTSPFGVRLLTQDQDVFLYNAWDNVEPDEEYNKYAELRLEFHRENPVPEDKKEYYNENPSKFWNDFYSSNQNRFFKDRYWLYIEFPELFSWTKHYTIPKDVKANAKKENTDGDGDEMVEQRNSEVSPEITCKTEAKPETDIEQKQDTNEDVDGTVNIMELGCGAGNTVFPLLQSISDSRMRIFACDYSKTAVDVVKVGYYILIMTTDTLIG